MNPPPKTVEGVKYFDTEKGIPIAEPTARKRVLSRLALPLLSLISRERALDLGLVPIDDERVIMALRYARGRTLDVGCGANNFIRSYGDGVGVDVFPWDGADLVIEDPAKLPFADDEFDTVSFLACLNHITNRADALREAARVLKPDGRLLVTMIPPRWGEFIHWIRFRNDPDHRDRHIDHEHELLGMGTRQIVDLLRESGFALERRQRFVFGLNNLYVARKGLPA
jgi:SAM-dependent methyltransferase